jgi:hypothetical protein
VWTSTEFSNKKLNEAYTQCKKEGGKMYLIFSVNNCGCFLGIAEMQSEVDFNGKFALWSKNIWMGKFKALWTHVKDVPNSEFTGLKSEDQKYITGSKDCTEVSFANGVEMYKIIASYPDYSSVLDMFEEYDKKERTDKDKTDQGKDSEPYERRRSRRFGRRRTYDDDS